MVKKWEQITVLLTVYTSTVSRLRLLAQQTNTTDKNDRSLGNQAGEIWRQLVKSCADFLLARCAMPAPTLHY